MFDKFPCLRIKRRGPTRETEIELRPSLIRWLLIGLVVILLLVHGENPGRLLRDVLHLP